MKLKWIMLLAILWVSGLATAQNTANTSFQIKGILLDSITQEGEPYATIKIVKKEAPARAVKMLVTDMKGKFQEKVPGLGNFVMTISSVGRSSIIKDFSVKEGEKLVDFGTLYIMDAANELGQVEVVAQKPLVKADIDKIEYNVQDDPDSKSNTVLEMLRKVPLVTVDGEDNIQVNGSGSFKVHVNGKPNNMMSNNPKEVLKSMPANSIKYIEVITNPGAKYDAEGVGGILNIVTVGSGFEGYTATFSGNASNTGAGGSAYATVKKGKLTVTGNYSVSYNNRPTSYSESARYNLNDAGEATARTANHGENDNSGTFQHGNLEASYEIDTLRLFTMSVGMYGGANESDGLGMAYMEDMNSLTNSTSPVYRYGSHSKNESSWYSIRGSVDYQRISAKVKDRMFTISYKVNTQPRSSDGYTRYSYEDGDMSLEWSNFLRLKNLRMDGKQNSAEHTFQADYTTPIAKIHTIETGVKYIIRSNTSEDWRYEADRASEDYELNRDRSSDYKHLNDILAAYAGYALRVKKISARAGLRYERTMQRVKYVVGQGEDFNVNFDDLVPSATFGYKLTDMSNVRLGYNMRIWRPGIWYLNPYINDTDPTNISMGNPGLKSEKSHAMNLSYSNFTQKFNINLSARYSFNNSGIERVIERIEPGKVIPGLGTTAEKDVLFSTYENIGRSKRAGLSAYLNWNATAKTRIYMNLSADYSYLNSPAQNLTNSGWSCFAYGGVQHTFPLEIRGSLNLMGSTPYIMLQGKGSSFYDYNISINRSFLKEKRLTLTAFAGNFFQKYMDNKNTLEGEGFRQESNYRYSRMRYGMSISYRIGELKASVKKAARSISNDDVKGGGGGEGGGAK